ncbi:hypothetical protein GALMADRAFT_273747 [Galerina marginata CBS 339.88]|uniref:Uncharacterized protein n=1 Tax=Galerina marginata (strain CBS 339.88) TaxID=685588 RepID=A0A067S877_GALM3|nr:hypothetical protein GALMADRAFT_273747 [Galerina marginata CBS 339.88]
MGSAQSYISSEVALTAIVVAGAIGLGYTQLGPAATSTFGAHAVSTADSQATALKKGKKKKQGKGAPSGDISETLSASKSQSQLPQLAQARAVEFAEAIPGQFDATPASPPGTELSAGGLATEALKPKKSKKKAKGKAASATPELGPTQTISSSVDYLSEASVKAAPTKNAKRQQTPSQQPQKPPPAASASSSAAALTRPQQQSTASLDTDSSWTRVGSHRRGPTATDADSSALSAEADPTTSDAGITPSVTGNSSPVVERRMSTSTEDESFLLNVNVTRGSGENRRTLAEKLLPKPRKTGVDDMLETSDFPTLSRVMRVQPLPNERPATGFSWGDYEDVRVVTDGGENDADGEDDGWGVVTSKRSKRVVPSTSAQPHVQKAPETMTKRQRQNAQKREDDKAAKAEAESERLARLAKHKRELEHAKMVEQFSGKSSGKVPSGGMKATVDERGKLVWE